MKKVTDRADDLTYTGAMDFKDGADKAVEYVYDANGNMTCDRNKKIQSISYNILNLPSEVKFDDGHITRYTYDAAGTKLKAEYLLINEQFMDWVMDGPAAETANVLSAGWNKGVDIGAVETPGATSVNGTTDEQGNSIATSKEYLNAHSKAKLADPRFVEPDISLDRNTGIFYINDKEKESVLK